MEAGISVANDKSRRPVFYGSLIFLQTFLWGVGNPVAKISLETIPPFYCMALRFTLAFILFMVFFGKKIIAQIEKPQLINCLIIGVFTAASFNFSTLSLLHTTATTSGFLLSFSVVFTPILSFLVLKEKLDKKLALGILIVMVGMYFLCGNSGSFSFGIGEIYALLSALTGAGMLTYTSKNASNIGTLAISASQCGITAVISFIFAFAFEDYHALATTSTTAWICILYLAVGCTCIAYALQNIALCHVSATFVSLAFCTEPIFTAISAFVLLHEVLSLSGLLGAALILVGLVIATLLSASTTNPSDPNSLKVEEK
ncbi:MAG: DMT family transporter [Anaerovoracaceae bacterium]